MEVSSADRECGWVKGFRVCVCVFFFGHDGQETGCHLVPMFGGTVPHIMSLPLVNRRGELSAVLNQLHGSSPPNVFP